MATASSLEGGSQENAGNAKMQKKCQKKRKNAADQGDELFWALRPRQDLMERIAETAGPPSLSAPCWCRKVRIRLKEGRPRPPAAGAGAWICCCRSGGSFLLWLSSRRTRLGRRSRHRETGRGPRIRRGALRRPQRRRRATIDAGACGRACGPCGQTDCDELQRLRTCGNSGVRAGGLM